MCENPKLDAESAEFKAHSGNTSNRREEGYLETNPSCQESSEVPKPNKFGVCFVHVSSAG